MGVYAVGTKAYFSNRVYKNTISKDYVDANGTTLIIFNQAKQFSFSISIKEMRSGQKRYPKSMHLTVKDRFHLNYYYANSAVQEAKAIQKSLNELNKLYISNKEIQITSVKNKIKKDKSRLTTLKKTKNSFMKSKPSFPKNSNVKKLGNFLSFNLKGKQTSIIIPINLSTNI